MLNNSQDEKELATVMASWIVDAKKMEDSKKENQAKVDAAWFMLEKKRIEMNVKLSDPVGMKKVLRAFSIEIIRQQPEKNKIVVNGVVFKDFSKKAYNDNKNYKANQDDVFRTKEDYLAYHSQNGIDGTDEILASAMCALGYQLVIKSKHSEPFAPYVQQCSFTPKECVMVNTGGHWKLENQDNSGQGDCMYEAMSQQIIKDYPKDAKKYDEDLVFDLVQTKVQEDNEITLKVKQDTLKSDQEGEARKAHARKILTEIDRLTGKDNYSTEGLLAMYHYAMATSDYLAETLNDKGKPATGYLKALDEEFGCAPESNPVRIAVETGLIDPNYADFIREKLVHALSVEAMKDVNHYNLLKGKEVTPAASTCAEDAKAELKAPTNTPRLVH